MKAIYALIILMISWLIFDCIVHIEYNILIKFVVKLLIKENLIWNDKVVAECTDFYETEIRDKINERCNKLNELPFLIGYFISPFALAILLPPYLVKAYKKAKTIMDNNKN